MGVSLHIYCNLIKLQKITFLNDNETFVRKDTPVGRQHKFQGRENLFSLGKSKFA